jgi:hypothetical protein
VTLDEDRGDAIRRSVGQGLAWNLELELPRLLGKLKAIDAQHQPEPVTVKRSDDVPPDAELAAWIERNPEWFAAWQRKQDRINGAPAARRAPARRRPGQATGRKPSDQDQA